jgi:hypothetical protein
MAALVGRSIGGGDGTMTVLRALAIAAALAIGWCITVSAQQPHWLVGTWDGERKNITRSRTGTDRSLIVEQVARNGRSAKARWITATASVNVTLTIDKEVVTFTTPGADGNAYRLVRKGEQLEGTWTHVGRGSSGAIELFKQ